MELETVLTERHSTRIFLDTPVAREMIEKLLGLLTQSEQEQVAKIVEKVATALR